MPGNTPYHEMKSTVDNLLPATTAQLFKYFCVAEQGKRLMKTEISAVIDCTYLLHKQLEYSVQIENASDDIITHQKQQTGIELSVMVAIMAIQSEYFSNGNIRSLKVMRLKDVAGLTGFHLSTVAKVVRNKFIVTPFATISIKELFSEGMCMLNGELVSNRVIKNEIKELIETEGKHHPISDRQISELLRKKGYRVARRTVSKYREILRIPVSYARHM